MNIDFEFYKKQFFTEAREIIDKVNEDLLKVENDPDNLELLNSVFRGIHTIKGSAGGFELNEISEFTHHLETLLDKLREGSLKVTSEIIDAILSGVDHIISMIESCERGEAPEINYDLVEKFKSFLVSKDNEKIDDVNPLDKKNIHKNIIGDPQLLEYSKKGYNIYEIYVKYSSDELSNGFDPVYFLKNIKENSVIYKSILEGLNIPPIKELNLYELYLKPKLFIATDMNKEDIIDMAIEPNLVEVREVEVQETTNKIPFEAIDLDNLEEFMLDASEAIDNIEKYILEFEERYSQDSLNAIFRAVHTIKGDADYIGLKKLAQFTHKLESVLDRLRSNELKRDKHLIDTLLKGIDVLKNSILNLKMNKGYPDEIEQIIVRLDEYVSKKTEKSSAIKDISDDESFVFLEQANQFLKMIETNLKKSHVGDFEKKNVIRGLQNLRNSSKFIGFNTFVKFIDEALSCLDDMDKLKSKMKDIEAFIKGLVDSPKKLGEILIEEGKITKEDIVEVLEKQKPIGKLLVEAGKIKEDDVNEALKKQEIMEVAAQLKPQAVKIDDDSKTMRVEEKKIDTFGNIVGELIVVRNTYEYLMQKLNSLDGIDRTLVKLFKDNMYSFSRLTSLLQENLMSIRMVPIKIVFQKFQRVVRDISRKQGKNIELITDGEDTEIDKKVADMLSDPLIHLVRNSCDHGIESPSERIRAGKNEKGTIILRAYQEGSQIIVKIIDDGRGIDRKKLFQKALSMGYEYKGIDDPELLNFIFLPGISTKEQVTDISGRGVGMDVVKTSIDALGGKINIISEEGEGTEVTLSIPMSMGIEMSILLEVGNDLYAIPLDYVVETLKLPRNMIKKIHEGYGISHRGKIIPLQNLKNILYNRMDDYSWFIGEEISIVLLKSSKGQFGVVVDRFYKNMELTIKPVPDEISKIEFISGVTIMGDGRVVLVVNPEKMV